MADLGFLNDLLTLSPLPPSSPLSELSAIPTDPLEPMDETVNKDADENRRERLCLLGGDGTIARDELRHEAAEGLKAPEALDNAPERRDVEPEHVHDNNAKAVLEKLKLHGQTWGDFVEWISTPTSGAAQQRYDGLFRPRERQTGRSQVVRILDLWTTKNSPTGRRDVRTWATEYMERVVSQEATKATLDGVLMTRRQPISGDFFLSLSLSSIHDRVRTLCPTMASIMFAFSTTTRQLKDNTVAQTSRDRARLRVGFAMTTLLGERSQQNSLMRNLIGLYMYMNGASCQLIAIMSSIGVSSSYTDQGGAIEDAIERPSTATSRALDLLSRGAGLLRRISESCRLSARDCGETTVLGHVYDNINMVFKVAEQILGRKDTQENGTCATVFPLHDAAPDNMKTADLLATFDAAAPLAMGDIYHTPAEAQLFRKSLEHTILRTIISSSDLFARFRADADACLPATDDQMSLHKTETYPLPAMNIDESSPTGNTEVLDTIFTELEYARRRPNFPAFAALVFGDQLSISRSRTIISNRAGHEDSAQSYANIVFGPGFFHHQMAVTHGIIETHFGDPTAGHRNPASLSFFNTVLDRKPIVPSSLPPYRVCRNLIFTTLSAASLHCLGLVCGAESLEKYTADLSFRTLRKDITKIYDRRKLGSPFDSYSQPLTSGDMVFENASLFIRDALVFREFTDAIKGGYSGRIVRALKILTFMYRGSGRLKYAHECLHLIHNLTRVWPGPLRAIMINNWLVNPTGKPNAWVPVDLLQEHMNFWIKMVSPCISVFRKLALQMNETLGANLGTKHHSPDLQKDFESLCDLMRGNGVFRVEPGRVLRDMSNTEVPNVVASGLKQLSGPLFEYNKTFEQLQRRRRETPLVSPPSSPHTSPASSPSTVDTFPLSGVVLPSAQIATFASDRDDMPRSQSRGEEDDDYWRHYDADEYEPRAAFAEEDEPSMDLEDW
ncbi:hypothetical protein DICSQDRAFT_150154 [Dichomitus squalens LYAD-421 SS1]|uniref:DUF6589 domain-containing protein n=1 Tax=Dichomitus squalens (strain LYAD-421) TaxID=732165 RepID=R7SPJ2_DICSQ|nr:uncharacterized protein DICSQDRAFT_150154 [Dichomitus squalens LYAD-421 SS1]EJF56897.1 hypothetical protein DICSQDRAFT_150154 [Dichomitus squalens LYAD-421 SS1]